MRILGVLFVCCLACVCGSCVSDLGSSDVVDLTSEPIPRGSLLGLWEGVGRPPLFCYYRLAIYSNNTGVICHDFLTEQLNCYPITDWKISKKEGIRFSAIQRDQRGVPASASKVFRLILRGSNVTLFACAQHAPDIIPLARVDLIKENKQRSSQEMIERWGKAAERSNGEQRVE